MAFIGKWLGMVVALLTSVAGCGPKVIAGFDQYGYRNDAHPYRVVARDGQVMGPEWLIDNYYSSGGNLKPKSADDYLITYHMDTNDDGKEDMKEQVFLYDLRFVHKSHDAHIWLRTFPISTKLRQMELRVLAQRYVDAVAGSGFEAVQIDNTTVVGQTKRFAAQLIERGPGKIAKQDAYSATFDVANVDEATISSTSRTVRVNVVLIRPPFDYPIVKVGYSRVVFPAMMLVGYANLPEDFDKELPAFKDFLGRIQFGAVVGSEPFTLEQVSPRAKPADAASVPAAAPASVSTDHSSAPASSATAP